MSQKVHAGDSKGPLRKSTIQRPKNSTTTCQDNAEINLKEEWKLLNVCGSEKSLPSSGVHVSTIKAKMHIEWSESLSSRFMKIISTQVECKQNGFQENLLELALTQGSSAFCGKEAQKSERLPAFLEEKKAYIAF